MLASVLHSGSPMTPRFLSFAGALLLSLATATPAVGQTPAAPKDQSNGVPILWKDPGNLADRDLFWGSGGQAKAPQAPFTFVSEDSGGTNPKVIVTDARGTKWSVKFPASDSKDEVHSEVAASRLVWALGYMVEDVYFVGPGKIQGVTKLERAKDSIAADGTFEKGRFELRDASMKRLGRTWEYDKSPFKDTRELSGLKILLALLSNWDNKTSNTDVLQVRTPQGQLEDRYIMSDYGATFGKMGSGPTMLTGRSRWNLEDFQKGEFIKEVKDGKLRLNYSGVIEIDDVPVEHARWFADLASRLTETQVRRAFDAAGATEAQAAAYTAAVIQRIGRLRTAVGPPTPVSPATTRRVTP